MPNGKGSTAERPFTIGELAREFGITTRTIRFYEAKGLIAPQRKGTARVYARRDRARLLLILRGKNLGFALEEIKEYLELYDADPTQVTQLRHLLGKIDERLVRLRIKKADLDRTQQELKAMRAQVVAALRQRSSPAGGGAPP
jgi:DNA-binding transcriptional MerR regulator